MVRWEVGQAGMAELVLAGLSLTGINQGRQALAELVLAGLSLPGINQVRAGLDWLVGQAWIGWARLLTGHREINEEAQKNQLLWIEFRNEEKELKRFKHQSQKLDITQAKSISKKHPQRRK
ncbi:hypothetical protein BY996DRAFT_6449245 [Phakopsora pachyrhizi]|nr:hypothetical protein BY996DRAFT_6449245 [Phakopsora pachyrhizi]